MGAGGRERTMRRLIILLALCALFAATATTPAAGAKPASEPPDVSVALEDVACVTDGFGTTISLAAIVEVAVTNGELQGFSIHVDKLGTLEGWFDGLWTQEGWGYGWWPGGPEPLPTSLPRYTLSTADPDTYDYHSWQVNSEGLDPFLSTDFWRVDANAQAIGAQKGQGRNNNWADDWANWVVDCSTGTWQERPQFVWCHDPPEVPYESGDPCLMT